MNSTESRQLKSSRSKKKKIEFQFDLFESFDEDDVLYHEIETLRASLNKFRRRIFAELADVQKDLELMKEENLKLKFALYHENDQPKEAKYGH